MSLVPVTFLSPCPLLIVLLVTILLAITTRRLGTAESSTQSKEGEQESSGKDGVVEEEGGVEGDVVGASAGEHCPGISVLRFRLLNTVDVNGGGGDHAKHGEEEEGGDKEGRQ